MRLGYMAQISRTLGFDPGFNEAEAHAPRIQGRSAGQSLANVCSFNEAEAHAPRIQICHFVTILPSNASMRPRRMRLGYEIFLIAISLRFLLLQ